MKKLINRIKRKLLRLRLHPIRVFCLHHVCKEFEFGTMNACDWMAIDDFKKKVFRMQQIGVEFISLTEAYKHICSDLFRRKKYAVLTFDDGYWSLKEIIPWLLDNKLPFTLFFNGKYLDGRSYRDKENERYLTKEDVFVLTSPLVEIGSHGWEHLDATQQTLVQFVDSFQRNDMLIRTHPRYVPFYAYTYGKHTLEEDVFLQSVGIIPLLIDGEKNINNKQYIQRELL